MTQGLQMSGEAAATAAAKDSTYTSLTTTTTINLAHPQAFITTPALRHKHTLALLLAFSPIQGH